MINDNVWFLVKGEFLFKYFIQHDSNLAYDANKFRNEIVCVQKNGDIREHVGWTRGVEYGEIGAPGHEVPYFIPWYGDILVTAAQLGGEKWISWVEEQRKYGQLP